MTDTFVENYEERMKQLADTVKDAEQIEKKLETASPEQLKKLFNSLSIESSKTPNKRYYRSRYAPREGGYTVQNDENGNIKWMATKLNDGTGLGVLKTEDGFAVLRGKIKELGGLLFSVVGNEFSYYDENSNLLKQTVYEPDDSYKVQKFEGGKLKSTSFYDKDDNLIKRINKKGDAERRTTSDALDALNEMAPSGLRQRLKRAMAKEYRQTHPKTKRGSER